MGMFDDAPMEEKGGGMFDDAPDESSLFEKGAKAFYDFQMSGLKGASRIGSTLMAIPELAESGLKDLMGVKREGPMTNMDARNKAVTEGLRSMGVDPESIAGQAGDIAMQIAGTAGAGGALGLGAKAVGMTRLGEALATGGMGTGQAVSGFAPRVADIGIRTVGGGLGGAASAALVDPNDAGLGGAIGAALPVPAQLTGKLYKRFFGGRTNAAGNVMNKVAGDDADAIIARLEADAPIVPGSRATAGQAAAETGSTRFAALDDIVSGEAYSKQNAAREAANEAARRKIPEDIAGTIESRQQLARERSRAAAPYYEVVENSTAEVDVIPLIVEIGDIVSKNKNNDAVTKPLRDIARKLFNESGDAVETNPQALKSLRDDINLKMSKKTVDGAPEYDVKVLQTIKEKLDSQIGLVEPNFAEAKRIFAEKSIPLNQAEVGDILSKSLSSSMGKERGLMFSNAMQDAPKTLKKATGFGRYDEAKGLGAILNPDQVKSVEAVKKELLRNEEYKRLASAGRGETMKELSRQFASKQLPNTLNTAFAWGNRLLDIMQNKASEKTINELARIMQDPRAAAAAMKGVKPAERAVIEKIMALRYPSYAEYE